MFWQYAHNPNGLAKNPNGFFGLSLKLRSKNGIHRPNIFPGGKHTPCRKNVPNAPKMAAMTISNVPGWVNAKFRKTANMATPKITAVITLNSDGTGFDSITHKPLECHELKTYTPRPVMWHSERPGRSCNPAI